MNKLLQTTLIAAILSTGVMASEETSEPLLLKGNMDIGEGGEFQISKNDYKVTGGISFMGRDAKLIIDAGRTLEINGGRIEFMRHPDPSGGDTQTPEIILNGTLKLTKGGEDGTQMPSIHTMGGADDVVKISSGTSEIVDSFNYTLDGTTYTVKIPEEGTAIKSGYFVATKYETTQTAGGSSESTNITIIIENDDSIVWIKKGKIAKDDVGEDATGYNSAVSYWAQVSAENNEQLIDAKSLTDDGYDYYEKLDLSKFVQNGGIIDMSTLREYTGTLETDIADPTYISVDRVKPTSLGTVKLPYNCRFNNCDFSNVDRVEYTKLTVGESSAPGLEPVMEGEGDSATLKFNYIKKNVLKEGQVYGDYLTNRDLNVVVTTKNAEITEEFVDGDVTPLELEKLQKDTYDVKTGEGESETTIQFNPDGTTNRLWTDDLINTTQTITGDTTYNFGFSGSKAVNISGEGKAIFKGDNSEYEPAEKMRVPNNVEFAGNNTLFRFSQNYGHGIFSTGSEGYADNTVPGGKTITFSNGFELGESSSLHIEGKLIC